jgi:hypothetical protein
MMVIDNKFEFGQIVYIKTDQDQKPRMVVAMLVRPGYVEYQLNCGTDWSWQPEFVISEEKNVLITTTN